MEILDVARSAPSSHNCWYFNAAPLRFRRPFIQLSRKGFGISCNCNAFPKAIVGPNSSRKAALCRVAESEAPLVKSFEQGGREDYDEQQEGNLLDNGRVLQSTLRLVECAMFSAVAGLAYFLSNLLRIENYFGCFFPLPLVISSMRWGVAAGRKTMVATAMLLLILSGPLKAATYLLMHGFVGLCMGALWRLELNWGLSIIICTLVMSGILFQWFPLSLCLCVYHLCPHDHYILVCHLCAERERERTSNGFFIISSRLNGPWDIKPVFHIKVRSIGALGFVLLSSWLLRDNILVLITINAHASVSYMLAAVGINMVPSMGMIYVIFASLLLMNCGSFVFLLHVLYAIFLRRLGIKTSMSLPGWLEKAM